MHRLRTPQKTLILVVALAVAAGCSRLGVWQVNRLSERRAYNALLLARMGQPAVAIGSLSPDTAAGHYRLTTAHGTLDYTRELAWAPRIRHGSPGVNLLTPMRIPGTDTVQLIDRGWAYSPDARSVAFRRWREADSIAVTGYVETWMQACADTSSSPAARCADSTERVLHRLDRHAAERLVGAPVAPYLLMQTSDSALRPDSIPARIEPPDLDEGPHRGYAFQWFGFAIIALVGGVALAIRQGDAHRG